MKKLLLVIILLFLASIVYAKLDVTTLIVTRVVGVSTGNSTPTIGDALLLEIGDYLLLESGDKLLLE